MWAFTNLDQLGQSLGDDLLSLSLRSLVLALAVATLAVVAALVLAIAKRWNEAPMLRLLTFLAGMGYAIPGTVLALALLLTGTPLATGTAAVAAVGLQRPFPGRGERGTRCRLGTDQSHPG